MAAELCLIIRKNTRWASVFIIQTDPQSPPIIRLLRILTGQFGMQSMGTFSSLAPKLLQVKIRLFFISRKTTTNSIMLKFFLKMTRL